MSYDPYRQQGNDPYAGETVLAGPQQQPSAPASADPYGGETVLAAPGSMTPPPPSQPSAPSYAASASQPSASPYGSPGYAAPGPTYQNYTPPPPAYAPQPYGGQPGYPGAMMGPRPQELEKMALSAFICGLVGLILGSFTGLLLLAGVVGVVLGVAALGKFKEEPQRYHNKWMAITGIITGALATLWMIIGLIIIVWVASSSS